MTSSSYQEVMANSLPRCQLSRVFVLDGTNVKAAFMLNETTGVIGEGILQRHGQSISSEVATTGCNRLFLSSEKELWQGFDEP